jgi:hypothetical protein
MAIPLHQIKVALEQDENETMNVVSFPFFVEREMKVD